MKIKRIQRQSCGCESYPFCEHAAKRNNLAEPKQHTPQVIHARFGWYVDFGNGFQAAMQDEKRARESAAAHDLLEACKVAKGFFDEYERDPDSVALIRHDVHDCLKEAIAKAEVRS